MFVLSSDNICIGKIEKLVLFGQIFNVFKTNLKDTFKTFRKNIFELKQPIYIAYCAHYRNFGKDIFVRFFNQ